MRPSFAKASSPQINLCQISQEEINAAAKAWLEWQFNGKDWDSASLELKEKFKDGALVVLTAAALARRLK